jgi:chemotaxis protein methyltransferase CheR
VTRPWESPADDALTLVSRIIEERVGLSFPAHKKTIIETRLQTRLTALGLANLTEYLQLLRSNPNGECDEIAKVVTNNETYFFRSPHHFQALVGVAPTLSRSAAAPGKLRILCAGCSSGEEAYTINFYVKDHRVNFAGTNVQIDALDIDRDRLGTAQRAQYRARSLRTMTKGQIARYLYRSTIDRHAVRAPYRVGVSFAYGNLMSVESLRRRAPIYDCVFCRNVLMYFSEESVGRAVENIARVLRPGGLLFLSSAESIMGVSDAFKTIRLGDGVAYRRREL